jgi:hypothetical protein
MHQIIFTSLPKTLTGGSGYGIVAATADCPRLALEEVTKLAGYSEIYPASHPSKDQNPVNYFFVKQSGFHILGRLSSAPNDYSGRSNYLGQFFILGADNLPDCGPAALLKVLPFIDRFEGEARYLPAASLPYLPGATPAVCTSWQRWTGDAGWAGAVADQIQTGSQVNILYGQACRGSETLNLLTELFSLLPKLSRWQTTFSTHVEGFPKGTATKIRMLQEGDNKTQDFLKQPHLFDLTKKARNLPTESLLVTQARTGIIQEPVLKLPAQNPAWPQKKLSTPLQPELEIGNNQDWYTIQPEPMEPKGKYPQKIHVQPATPPVLGKKPKPETSKNDLTTNYQAEKHESKGTSWLLVLAFLFLGLLLGAGGGFGGGYWFRTGNEEALEIEKTNLASDIAKLIDQNNTLTDDNNNLRNEAIKLYAIKQTDNQIINGQRITILGLTQNNKRLTDELTTCTNEVHKKDMDLKNLRKNSPTKIETNNPINEETKNIVAELVESRKVNFTSESFLKSLPQKGLSKEFMKSIKEKSKRLDEICLDLTDLNKIRIIKESHFILQRVDWIKPNKEMDKILKNRSIIDPCTTDDDKAISNEIKDLITYSNSNEIVNSMADQSKQDLETERKRKKYFDWIKDLALRAKNASLFFGSQKQEIYGSAPSFKLIHINKIIDSFDSIENAYQKLKPIAEMKLGNEGYPEKNDLNQIDEFLILFRSLKSFRDEIKTSLNPEGGK